MKFEIKSWLNGGVLFSADCDSFSACVVLAVKSGANLSGADLSGANLSRANLFGADLSTANLFGANLSRAELFGANLSRADLSGADLSGADLSGANLSGADLSRANLSRADLSGANLSRAELSGANLTEIANAKLSLAQTRIVPQEGAFVGWKKLTNGVIAELVIPHDAERVNAAGSRKCRASKVHVWNMWDRYGKQIAEKVQIPGQHDHKTLYEVGKETLPDSFDPRITEECSHGIHFFITREEAEDY